MEYGVVAMGTVFPLTFTLAQVRIASGGLRCRCVPASAVAHKAGVLHTTLARITSAAPNACAPATNTHTPPQAFTRRDRATLLIANLKASLVGLYLMHRDWQQAGYTNGQLGNDRQPQAVTSKAVLMDLAINIRR